VLDPNNISWEKQAIELRVSAQREVPVLTTPTRIPPAARLVVVVWVLSKALLPWLIKKKLRPFATPEDSRAYISLRMRKAVERLGSTSSLDKLFPVAKACFLLNW
jgi:ubiquinone biosynthesis protein